MPINLYKTQIIKIKLKALEEGIKNLRCSRKRSKISDIELSFLIKGGLKWRQTQIDLVLSWTEWGTILTYIYCHRRARRASFKIVQIKMREEKTTEAFSVRHLRPFALQILKKMVFSKLLAHKKIVLSDK